jgi:CHAT domain-containing protein
VADAYSTQNQQLITKLKSQEFDLSKELEALQIEMEKASPKFKSALNQRVLPSWQEVKMNLDTKTAMVSYVITDSAKYILVGNASKLILKSIPAKTDLEKLVRGFTVQVKFRGPGLKAITEQLTEIVWTPVETALAELGTIEKVIVLPEGPLNFLPFEALGKESYLVEKYTIHYQLSGALIANQTVSQVGAKPSFIAMAPVFEDKETNFVNKSCQRFVQLSRKTDTTSRAFNLNGEYITPLPETETEVEAINKIYIDKGLFSKLFIKEAANEELIKKGALADFDYIHLATHGFVNSQYPELSGLLLTQNKNSSEDGILYSGEILGLALKAELVTLSACETALGKKVEGEGVRGLTTAFLFAGARTVISSLWKVADESTSIMMIDFYTNLHGGKDKASALRSAKLSLLKDPKYSHPYYWAPFIQIGGN